MAKIEITKTELVWPGKYNEDGTLKEVPRVSLPFQVIETVNESRATREARKERGKRPTLFDIYEGKEGDTFEEGWKNKLIWGDNLLVMGSLLEKFAGKIDLIYIDPPFATGADFSFTAPIGEAGDEVFKEQSVIEEKAYRDSWGKGLISYLDMMRDRLILMRDLLSPTGSMYLHLDPMMSHYVKLIMDEVFGGTCYRNEIVWQRLAGGKSDAGQYGRNSDRILFYTASEKFTFFPPRLSSHREETIRDWYNKEDKRGPYVSRPLTAAGRTTGDSGKPWRGINPTGHWTVPRILQERYERETGLKLTGTVRERLDVLADAGYIDFSSSGIPSWRRYLDEAEPPRVHDIWADDEVKAISRTSTERLAYPTQKPEALLERIIKASSKEGDLIADFFCGSGTSLAVAEKLGRRWIGCDLGRWAIHVTRKRLLSIPNCRPFEVLNLGKYERQYWQGVTFGDPKDKSGTERRLYEYLAFILKLYGAQPVSGMAHLHGKKGKAMVHIGAVDAPVTIAEIDAAVDECAALKQSELHVLGWEWEMGIAASNEGKGGLMHEAAKKKGVKLLLLQIPREVMEQQAAAKGDVRFFELAYFEAKIHQPKKLTVQIELTDFASPNMNETIPEEIRAKITKWSDYIDYWAVDWDFQNDTFMQGWVAYRTRKERKLPLSSDPHTYEKAGKYRIVVKVIDIFGNDTSQAFDVEVK